MELLQVLTPVNNQLNLSFGELLQLLMFLAGIVAVWIGVKVKLTKIETGTKLEIEGLRKEFDLKLKAIESKTIGLSDFLSTRLSEFVQDNKEDHTEIKGIITTMNSSITILGKQITEIAVIQRQ